jgi:hypothetical protein
LSVIANTISAIISFLRCVLSAFYAEYQGGPWLLLCVVFFDQGNFNKAELIRYLEKVRQAQHIVFWLLAEKIKIY